MTETKYRDWLTKDEADAFIGNNSPYYLDKWKTHSNSPRKGWNWAAVFFGIAWMAYRKMYLEAILSSILFMLISFGIEVILGAFQMSLNEQFYPVAFQIFAGGFGNVLYRNKALRILRKTMDLNEKKRLDFLRAKGGVSIVGSVICVLIVATLAILSILL